LDALDFASPLLGIDIPPPCLVVLRLSWSKGIFAFVLEAKDAEGLAFAFALEAIAPGGGQLPSVFVVDAVVAVVVRLRFCDPFRIDLLLYHHWALGHVLPSKYYNRNTTVNTTGTRIGNANGNRAVLTNRQLTAVAQTTSSTCE